MNSVNAIIDVNAPLVYSIRYARDPFIVGFAYVRPSAGNILSDCNAFANPFIVVV